MTKIAETVRELYKSCNIGSDHSGSDYFTLIRNLVEKRKHEGEVWQRYIDQVYLLVMDEIITNLGRPRELVTFGICSFKEQFLSSGSQACMRPRKRAVWSALIIVLEVKSWPRP